MRIVIPITENYDEAFIDWLVMQIKSEMISSIVPKKFKPFIAYQQSQQVFKSKQPELEEIDFIRVVLQGIELYSYRKAKTVWIIEMQHDKLHRGYLNKVSSICKFINYGLLDLKGYPIFTNVLNRVSAYLSSYYNRFLLEFPM